MDDLRAHDRPDPALPRGVPTTSSWSCSTASTGTCSGAYGGTEFATPSIDAFAASALRFTGHHAGSLPCMPARHDILVGALDFPWRPWGSIEVWEDAVTRSLRRARGHDHAGVGPSAPLRDRRRELPHRLHRLGLRARPRERPVADHPGPHVDGLARPCRSSVPAVPPRLRRLPHLVPLRGGLPRSTDDAGGGRLAPDVGARTTTGSSSWSTSSTPTSHSTRPSPTPSLYNGDEPGAERAIWPPYLVDARGRRAARPGPGPPPAQQLRVQTDDDRPLVRPAARGHRRRRAGRHRPAWSCAPTTATTWASTTCSASRPRPSTASWAGSPSSCGGPDGRPATSTPSPRRSTSTPPSPTCSAPTSATRPTARRCCRSSRARPPRCASLALFGYWGRHVGVTDGRRRYLRGCGDENLPLSMWSNRWSTMPVHPLPELRLPRPDDRAELRTMPGTDGAGHRASRSGRATPSRSGRSARRRRTRCSSTRRSTRPRRRTGPAAGTRPNSSTGSPAPCMPSARPTTSWPASACRLSPTVAGHGTDVSSPPGRRRAACPAPSGGGRGAP